MHFLRSLTVLFCGCAIAACAAGQRPNDAGRADSGDPRDAVAPVDARPSDASDASDGSDASGIDAFVVVSDSGPMDDTGVMCPSGREDCDGMCVSLVSDLMHCGDCDTDCTALAGVDSSRVRCISGACLLSGACTTGFGNCDDIASTGCEEPLDSATHCGNCVVTCSGATPVCSRSMAGAYSCTSSCSGTTPDMCGTLCTDVRSDPNNCGGCMRPCPDTIPNGHPTCAASSCGIACDSSYHDCSGACLSNSDPDSCGSRCTPCPAPMLGSATCLAGVCGISCAVGATACSGDCVDITTSAAHCGGCSRPCAGVCVGGVCDTGIRIEALSGDMQTGYIDQVLAAPIVVLLRDAAMAPVPGMLVTFTAPAGAVITPATATTDAMGRATATARLGRAATSYVFTATNAMALTPVTITAVATLPPTGTIFPIANAAHTSGTAGTLPGPATVTQSGAIRGVAVASDGTVYFADTTYHVVRAISPAGVESIVAGRVGMFGVSGDLGPATMALLRSPSGLALDDTAHILYIADTTNNRIRGVDLLSGVISTIAGGGTAPAPDYGDGGSAVSAALLAPGQVRLGPDGMLYIADTSHNRIRRVNLMTGIISAWITGSTTCTGAVMQLYSCNLEPRSCDVAWDAGGRAFVSGYWCGTSIGTTTWGIARRESDGTFTRIAGLSAGLTADGAAASASVVNGAGTLTFDPAGNLYVVETTGQRIRRIDGTNGTITTLVGTGVAGYGMDYVPASGQALSSPWGVAFDSARSLFASEAGNFGVRQIQSLGAATATSVTLAVYSGMTQSIDVDRQVPTALAVRLTDAGGSPLASLPITFVPVDEGAGVVASSATTTAIGVAAVYGRPGLVPGPYRIEGRFDDIHGVPVTGSPVTFTINATAPAAGTIFTAVDVDRVSGMTGGPATYARIGTLGGLAAAADGTIYLADRLRHVVWRLTPRGDLSVFAGRVGSLGFTGDGGPATSAQLYAPHSVALDAPRGILYIADRSNNRIRAVDLATGNIRLVAGSSLSTLPAPYGDAGPATSAYFSAPADVAVDAAGLVYVSDTGHNRIRVVDPGLGLVDAWVGSAVCTSPLEYRGCGSSAQSCHVVFEPDGSAFLTGQICGNVLPLTTTPVWGIVRRAPDGTLTRIAGRPTGMSADGALATETLINGAGWIARAADGALHYVEFTSQRIRRIDSMAGTVTTVTGTGVAGFSGEYVPALGAQLNTPWGMVLANGHLFIADSANYAVRVIW